MGVANRALDKSERMHAVQRAEEGVVGVSTSIKMGVVPFPSKLKTLQIAAQGLSGAPIYNLQIRRWTAGGETTFSFAGALTIAAAFGVSGGMATMGVSQNSALNSLQTGDMLELISSGANTASTDLIAVGVLEALQDIKRTFGVAD